MRGHVARAVALVIATAVVAIAVTIPSAGAAADDWPAVFDPSVLLTLNLTLDEQDWDTIRRDTTNEIEVPAMFWADGEPPILVSVRRKSSRALPSESNPIKVGLKVDINEFVDQTWHGLAKVSLENGADSGIVEEGLAWHMHHLASGPEGYGYTPAYAAWVGLNVNGSNIGVYVNAEQRDKQALRNRGLWVSGETWLYEQDGGGVIIEEGNPDSPAVNHLCYSPFRPKGKSACSRPTPDAALEADLLAWIDMQGMLAECAVDALTDNTDALCSHGKNSFFVDFSEARMTSESRRRLYLAWDLDTVFHNPSSNIYAVRSGRKLVQNPYESVILNDSAFRSRYNTMIRALTDPGSPGPLSAASLVGFLDQSETLLGPALASDPYAPSGSGGAAAFDRLREFMTARVASARSQALANTNPPPRP